MQHPFFSPLSEQELALLLVTLTVGGGEHIAIFQNLAGAPAARLADKAQALLQIAADKRIPLMVRELKAALDTHHNRGIERLDPSWIVHGLKGESPRVVATILLGLPPPLVRSVLRRLPPAVRTKLPPRPQIKAIDPQVAQGVRHLFEAQFVAMPARGSGPFCFADIIHLERPELFVLIRDLGLTELGQAFVSVGKMALVELCRRLPREHAEELVHAVKVASRVDLPDHKSAQRFLSRVVVNFENTEELLQKSGLWRLAKACLAEPEAYRPVLAQRLPRRAAQYLLAFLQKAGEMEDLTGEVQQRLQDAIVVRIAHLSRAGVIGESYQSLNLHFHDPQAGAQGLEPPAFEAFRKAEAPLQAGHGMLEDAEQDFDAAAEDPYTMDEDEA